MDISPKEARLKLGLNQQKMSEVMGVHRQTWVKWERGERAPDAAAVTAIEALLWLHEHGKLSDFLESRAIIV